MSIELSDARDDFRLYKCHYWCTCWRIEREDGTVKRFTDHDLPLTILEGEEDMFGVGTAFYTYEPVGGVDATAREARAQLESSNVDFMGVINSSDITAQDLNEGKYDNAEIYEYLVNWRWPWIGPIMKNRWFIKRIRFTGTKWEAEADDVTYLVGEAAGEQHSLSCRYDLGDTRCGYSFTGDDIEMGGVVHAVVAAENRVKFTGKTGGSNANWGTADVWTYGKLEWLTGNNAGLLNEVKVHDNVQSTPTRSDITLMLQTLYAIQVGDTFKVWIGCDRSQTACIAFNNIANFGGEPFLPGTDRVLQGV